MRARPVLTCSMRRCGRGNIFRKLEERGETLPDFAEELNAEAMARQLAIGGLLADSAGGVESGRGGGARGGGRGTGARGAIRVPTGADV